MSKSFKKIELYIIITLVIIILALSYYSYNSEYDKTEINLIKIGLMKCEEIGKKEYKEKYVKNLEINSKDHLFNALIILMKNANEKVLNKCEKD